MRIGVTGGRFYANRRKVREVLGLLRVIDPVLVHGAASGADRWAREWAEENRPGWRLDPFPADWDRMCDNTCTHGPRRMRRDRTTFCPQAGPIRNQAMVESGLDVLVAFPGGNGTLGMVRRAKTAGVLVLRVEE